MCGQRLESLRQVRRKGGINIANIARSRSLLSRLFFSCVVSLLSLFYVHTYIRSYDYSVVCLVLTSFNAYDGVLSARRDVLARGPYPLLSRRRGRVREWDESCSSEQDCGCRTHEVRYQCDSHLLTHSLHVNVCDNQGVASDAHPHCMCTCVCGD